ncbi:MAG: flagellar biosynthetic protein FliO, partial [Pseudomonadota bacterium]|nr:flagellar biosynthetic protein FliO [Pseudomonadota bacterium]
MARFVVWLTSLLSTGLPILARAEEVPSEAAQTASRAPDTVATIMSLGLGLVAVIAVIYGCAWLIRRMSGMTGMN